jgi:glycosyltransferase involved in cell wall biosynthesis
MLTSHQKQYLIDNFSVTTPISLIYYNVNEIFFSQTAEYNENGYILSVGDDISRDFQTVVDATERIENQLVIKSKWRPVNPVSRVTPVKYISDRLSDVDFRRLYENSNIVIISLFMVHSAGGITSLFEAMAMGKAIIISESSLTVDFVENETNCLVVPPQDVNALENAIRRLINSKELQMYLGKNARCTIDSKFSSKDLANRIVSSIDQIVKKT